MAQSRISPVSLAVSHDGAGPGRASARVAFSIQGGIRDAFDGKGWERAYDRYDNVLKIKYGIRLRAGGIKKRELGSVDSYRKASIFWTRNPKLVNAVKERKIWVQVAKNFVPYIRLTEEEVRQELFDFDEQVPIDAASLGPGSHKISAEVFASWQKHDYAEAETIRAKSPDAELGTE